MMVCLALAKTQQSNKTSDFMAMLHSSWDVVQITLGSFLEDYLLPTWG